MNKFTGELGHTRTESDYDNREIASSGVVDYLTKAKAIKVIGKYPIFDQKSTSSCVAFSVSLCLGILEEQENGEFKDLSKSFIYRQRPNYPQEGMTAIGSAGIVKDMGTCLETTLPTPLTEPKINNVVITSESRKEARTYRVKSYIFIFNKYIDELKDRVNMGIPVSISVWCDLEEWKKEYPEFTGQMKRPISHRITILPNSAYIYRGKKYLIIQDSSKFGGIYYRHLSEDFIKNRMTHGQYYIDMPNQEPDKKKRISIKYIWNRDLKIGDRGQDVKKLQEVLKELGFFTLPYTTDYFGGITKKALIDFQEYYANPVLSFFGLTKGTGYFGKSSKNQIYKLMK